MRVLEALSTSLEMWQVVEKSKLCYSSTLAFMFLIVLLIFSSHLCNTYEAILLLSFMYHSYQNRADSYYIEHCARSHGIVINCHCIYWLSQFHVASCVSS